MIKMPETERKKRKEAEESARRYRQTTDIYYHNIADSVVSYASDCSSSDSSSGSCD